MAEKIFVGNGKVLGNYGQLKISFKIADIQQYANDKGYVNLVVAERKEPDKFGNTHSVAVDTWKPDPNRNVNQQSAGYNPAQAPVDRLPF